MRPIIITLFVITAAFSQPIKAGAGFLGASWGASPADVQRASGGTGWQATTLPVGAFPAELKINLYKTKLPLAGYPAEVTCYFVDNRFFQATARFDFSDLQSYDFNYNVYISVDRYYREIKKRTKPFVVDMFDLLAKRYGKKQPYFKDNDPRRMFDPLDRRFAKETWNLKYHPFDYYKGIRTCGYAQWDFAESRAIFSLQVSPADTVISYTLSLTSVALQRDIARMTDSLRMRGL